MRKEGLTGVSTAGYSTSKNLQLPFCALEYRPPGWSTASARVAPVILFVLREDEDGLRFLIHPELRSIVQGEDLNYLDSLLTDFVERGKMHPAPLFKQMSSLGVGPLATHECGSKLSDHPSLKELSAHFVEV